MKDRNNIETEETITLDSFIDYCDEICSELSDIEGMLNDVSQIENLEASDLDEIRSYLSDVIYALK